MPVSIFRLPRTLTDWRLALRWLLGASALSLAGVGLIGFVAEFVPRDESPAIWTATNPLLWVVEAGAPVTWSLAGFSVLAILRPAFHGWARMLALLGGVCSAFIVWHTILSWPADIPFPLFESGRLFALDMPFILALTTLLSAGLLCLSTLLISKAEGGTPRRDSVSASFSLAAFGLVGVGLLGSLFGNPQTSGALENNFVALAASLIAASGLLLAALLVLERRSETGLWPRWLPTPLASCTLLITLTIWLALSWASGALIRSSVQATATRVSSLVDSSLKKQMKELRRMADRWSEFQLGSDILLREDAFIERNTLTAGRGLALLNEAYRPLWIKPSQGNEWFMKVPFQSGGELTQLLNDAWLLSSEPVLLPFPQNAPPGIYGLALPLRSLALGEERTLVGIASAKELLELELRNYLQPTDYTIRIHEGGHDLFLAEPDGRVDPTWTFRESLLSHPKWSLEVIPSQAQVNQRGSWLADAILCLGGVASLLIFISIRLAQESADRAAALGEIRLGLEREVLQRLEFEQSRQRLLEILESADDPVWMADHSGSLEYLNQAGRRLLGVGPDGQLSGMTLSAGHSAESALLLEQKALPEAGASGLWKGETIIEIEPGLEIPLSQVILAHYDNQGQVAFFSSIARDITELKSSEYALRQSERNLAATLNSIGDAVIATDFHGQITRMNPVAEELTGWTLEEAKGRPLPVVLRLVDGETGKLLPDPVPGIIEHGSIPEIASTASLEQRFGLRRIVTNTGAPLRDLRGENVGAVIVIRDITQRALADRQQRRLEEKFQHAQRLESLGLLAGGVAHDFNNLLAAIIGNTDLALSSIEKGISQEKIALLLTQVKKAGVRASDLTKQMLAYSGRGRFKIEQLDLNELIKSMAELLQAVTSKKTTLVFHLSGRIPKVEGDSSQLQQVIINLVTNASEAIGDRPGQIKLRTQLIELDVAAIVRLGLESEVEPGTFCSFEVSDDGAGIDQDKIGKIFDPFFTTKFTGRGLGLAAVVGIVRGHGGAIKVSSQRGQGTVFSLLLPSALCESDVAKSTRPLSDTSLLERPKVAEEAAKTRAVIVDADTRPAEAFTAPGNSPFLQEEIPVPIPPQATLIEGPPLEPGPDAAAQTSRRGASTRVFSRLGKRSKSDRLQKDAAVKQAGALKPSGDAPRFLVVDDESAVRAMATALLNLCGFDSVQAISGMEALEMMQTQRESIMGVLIDLSMPELDGHKALLRFRAIKPDVRIILTGGYTDDEEFEESEAPDACIRKPFTAEEFLQVIRELNIYSQ